MNDHDPESKYNREFRTGYYKTLRDIKVKDIHLVCRVIFKP